MKKCFPAISILVVTFLCSCGPNYIFEAVNEIPNGEWTYEDTLNFEVAISDTLAIYNLYLDIEHSTDYAKQNIYIMIYTRFPSGQRIEERVAIDFADKSGQWYGKCNKTKCSLRINIQTGAFFNAQGKHIFTVEQFMRINPLPGIKSIAFRIEDTGEKRTVEN